MYALFAMLLLFAIASGIIGIVADIHPLMFLGGLLAAWAMQIYGEIERAEANR